MPESHYTLGKLLKNGVFVSCGLLPTIYISYTRESFTYLPTPQSFYPYVLQIVIKLILP